MNEVIIVAHNGDMFNEVVLTAMDVVKVKTVSYALIHFNGTKVFIHKDTTEESAMAEYLQKQKEDTA